jgi:hypothetical protein
MAELEMWRVEELPDGFAERVLARMDDELAFDDDASVLLTDPDEEAVHVTPTPVPRSRWAAVVALACAAAAALVLWLLRPAPQAPSTPPPPRVVVSFAEPVLPADHGLDPESIRRTLAEKLLPHVRLCHEVLAINTTFASGQMVLELDVVRRDGRGVVTRAEFDPISELEDPSFRDCILTRARVVTFAAPRGEAPVEIEVPLELQDPWASNYDVPAD